MNRGGAVLVQGHMTNLRPSRRETQRDESSKDASADMTPMIDVVFLLIIFFLCIDFKVLEAKLPAYLPKDRGSNGGEPVESLKVHIVCDAFGAKVLRPSGTSFRLEGHRVHYDVGPRRNLATIGELTAELKAISQDPNRMVPDPAKPGQMKPIDVVVLPGPGVVYADVARCVDSVTESGFTDINFGVGEKRR